MSYIYELHFYTHILVYELHLYQILSIATKKDTHK